MYNKTASGATSARGKKNILGFSVVCRAVVSIGYLTFMIYVRHQRKKTGQTLSTASLGMSF